MQLDFGIILDWLPAFGDALLVTLETTVCSLILGLLISIPLSLCKISNLKPLQWFAFFYTSVFRGVPLLVQVFMMYFGIPLVLPVRFTAFQAGTLVFAMNSAAYISESLKGGISAIDRLAHHFNAGKRRKNEPEALTNQILVIGNGNPNGCAAARLIDARHRVPPPRVLRRESCIRNQARFLW